MAHNFEQADNKEIAKAAPSGKLFEEFSMTPTRDTIAPTMPSGFASDQDLLGHISYEQGTTGCPVNELTKHPWLAEVHSIATQMADGAENGLENGFDFVVHHPYESAAIGVAAVGAAIALPEVAAWGAVVGAASWLGTLFSIETSGMTGGILKCDPNEEH